MPEPKIYDIAALPDWAQRLLNHYRKKLQHYEIVEREAMGLPEIEQRGRFWYSEKQKQAINLHYKGWDISSFAKIENRLIEFTGRKDIDDFSRPEWDDAIYLGEGLIYFAEEKNKSELIPLGNMLK